MKRFVDIISWIFAISIGLLGLGIAIFLIVAVICAPFIYLDSRTCMETGKRLNYTSEYSFLAGCVLTDENGKKFLLNQNRRIEVAE